MASRGINIASIPVSTITLYKIYTISEAPHCKTGENQGMSKLTLASFLSNTREESGYEAQIG
jgi:hypothetical protein